MENKPRIVFLGTPDFAVASLQILVENNYPVVGVITAPDKPAGRGKKLRASAVKVYAEQQGLHILQPTNLKAPEFIEELKALEADLQIVVAFRMLPELVWAMPKEGTFNLHASLLPQYRGAAPINWAVINGEKESGVTTFFLRQEIDTGAIIRQQAVAINEQMTAGDLHDELMAVGAKLVLETVQLIAAGEADSKEQDALVSSDTLLKAAPKIFKQDCRIDWNKSAIKVRNLIRGLSPYPAAWCEWENKEGKVVAVKIFDVSIVSSTAGEKPGTIQADGRKSLQIATADGWLQINSLQQAGKQRLEITQFLLGFQADQGWMAR